MKTTPFKNYVSILADVIVNYRNWLDFSPPLSQASSEKLVDCHSEPFDRIIGTRLFTGISQTKELRVGYSQINERWLKLSLCIFDVLSSNSRLDQYSSKFSN